MKKILILANNDVGLFKFRKELIEELLKENEVYISLPYGTLVEPLIEMGCKFIHTPIDRRGINPIKDIFLLKKYKLIMNDVKPDIVLTYTIKPNVYGGFICSKLKIPYIVNITGLGTAVENGGILQKITVVLYKLSMKKAQCIFFQNQENMDFFDKYHINKKKKQLIPGSGVNIDYFTPLPYPNDKTIEFVFIARVMKQKGIDQYIEAAKYIRKKYPQTKFHICGFCEEEYESILKDLEEKNIIQYHGLVSDIREILKITHCTIHPTYYPEGMSNVLLESCASARPIITTDRSGCREIVDDGINGYVVKRKNTLDLINGIEKFINLSSNEKEIMGVNGRKKVEKEFNRKIIVREYVEKINNG